MVAVRAKNVDFAYQPSRPLLSAFSLEMKTGEKLSLMGRNGTGKSTLGKLFGDRIRPLGGSIWWNRDVFKLRSDVIYVEQSPMNCVFPQQTVAENIAYPLGRLGWTRSQISDRTEAMASVFFLEHLASKLPKELSGGELQRLALAASLSWSPKLVILDEPFSDFDAASRTRAIAAVKHIVDESDATLMVITHSVSDAVELTDRCIVLRGSPVSIAADWDIATEATRIGDRNLVGEEILADAYRNAEF